MGRGQVRSPHQPERAPDGTEDPRSAVADPASGFEGVQLTGHPVDLSDPLDLGDADAVHAGTQHLADVQPPPAAAHAVDPDVTENTCDRSLESRLDLR